jgi:DNA-directed RNA polymerase subunit omega
LRPFPIDELVDRVGSCYSVVVAAAKRAKQIKDGAPPLVQLDTRNPLTIALHEIAVGLVEITEPVEEVEVVERPEVVVTAESSLEAPAPRLVPDLPLVDLSEVEGDEGLEGETLLDEVEIEDDKLDTEDLDEDLEDDDDDDDDDEEDADEDAIEVE